jgi:GAF domain-containing protein
VSGSDWTERLNAVASGDVRAQPERLCQLVVETLGVSGAGISMVTAAGNRGTVCATDDRAARIEDLQVSTGVGPCIEATESGSPILIGDLEHPGGVDISRWVEFAGVIREAGVRAVFVFPLRIGAITVGAMDLYRDTPGDLSQDDLTAAFTAADVASVALLHLVTGSADAFAPDPSMRADFRLHVHQATGMVAVQLNVPVEEALLRLRARAFAEGRSLSELAADIVAGRVRFEAEDQ